MTSFDARGLWQWLRAVGLAAWVVAGSPMWSGGLRLRSMGSAIAWCALYVMFAVGFWVATDAHTRARARTLAVVGQSLVAVALAALAMPHFEGALLAVVAAQLPVVASLRVSVAWALWQGGMLAFIISPTHPGLGTPKAVAEYLAFSAFAMAVVSLAQRESAARASLSQAHATLLGTQSMLADGARAAERLRLSRELHDAIGHGLTAASIHLQLAERTITGNGQEAVVRAKQAVADTLAEVRSLVADARAADSFDLASAISAMAASLRAANAVAIELELPDDFNEHHADRAQMIFRFVQEALTNAFRHSHAQHLWISAERADDGWKVRVRDDGVGASRVTKGSGLAGMEERIEEHGGRLTIDTAKGRGFTIVAYLPEVRAS